MSADTTEDEFYNKGFKYWSEIPPTINGMLGGFGFISQTDIKSSKQLLKHLFKLKDPPGTEYALDCGAGIGRISKFLLTDLFEKVDMVEQNKDFLETAKKYLGPKISKIVKFYPVGLQNFQPEPEKYDVVWIQWVIGHLTNKDAISFLIACRKGLKKNGVIILKENITSTDEIEKDELDSSITRPMFMFHQLFEQSKLSCFRQQKQLNVPKGLFAIYMFVLKPVENQMEDSSTQINEKLGTELVLNTGMDTETSLTNSDRKSDSQNITDNYEKVYIKSQSTDVECGRSVESKNFTEDKIISPRGIFSKTRPIRVLIRQIVIMSVIIAALVALGAVIGYFLGWIFLVQLILVALVAYIAAGKWRWWYVAAMTAPRDLRALGRYIFLVIQIKRLQRNNVTISQLFQRNVKKHPNKTCILFEDQAWTFAQVEEYSNKIANIFKGHGYKKGDRVALFLENKPEFICIWLGLSKIGVITPLINTNLRLSTLVHSITVAKSQAVIFGTELSDAISEILEKIEAEVALYQISCNNNIVNVNHKYHNLDVLVKDAASTCPTVKDPLNHHDCLVYIYTSGTTGLPKAAVINNSRYIFIAAAMHWLSNFKSTDIFYTPLPLYHTAGGCMTVGQMLIYGATVVIRKKFSASGYFEDCRKYNATVAQYIGEMCRYILAVPPSEKDGQHNVKMIYGNGLRPQIWKEFVDRFNIKNVGEFYGATEGNANIVNIDNTVGAIGFVSRIIPSVYPISIIKVDQQTGEPVRDAKGLCMPCKPNEPGVFIGKILPNNPSRAFLGYVDEEASKKKIVHDVFQHGDSAFLSGDILVADEFGNLFFKDRTGDTFRWKGENVSTAEVEAVMSNLVDYKDVVVYGVEIRGQEGRAGMAAILDPAEKVDLDKLFEGLKKTLPSYARPIFIRILRKIDLTGTYKLKKTELQQEGFDPSKSSDIIYYLDVNKGAYEKVTNDVYNKINEGILRV